MRWLDRLPRPGGGWASPLPFLQMPEEEYRTLLRERGYGDQYIEEELRQLREARRRYNLPGPPEQKDEKAATDGLLERLAKRRRERGEPSNEGHRLEDI